MAYPPGSFTRNFAWHGRGLQKLYFAIRSGFAGSARPVGREEWRASSGIDDRDLSLLPVNFYLNNFGKEVTPDELVLRALAEQHSRDWDRLALFALNLSIVGTPPDGADPLPMRWANEFVRERLYQTDSWQASALSVEALDAFFLPRIEGSVEGRRKSRRNYRHLWELCGYLPSPLPEINSGAASWMGSALFLAWDRHLPTSRLHSDDLLAAAREIEVHKLLGLPADLVGTALPGLAELYISVGGVHRTSASGQDTEASNLLSGNDTGADEVVERAQRAREEQLRNQALVVNIKVKYEDTCCYCGTRLEVGNGRFYSEAAHIKPLGRPSNGPDKLENLIVLCPNHHKQFDRGVIRLVRQKQTLQWLDVLTGSTHPLALRHVLDEACVDWHSRWSSNLFDV